MIRLRKNRKPLTWDKLIKDNPNLKDNPIIPIAKETVPIETWVDMVKDFPTIEDYDIIDIYIFKNGLLVWPKK